MPLLVTARPAPLTRPTLVTLTLTLPTAPCPQLPLGEADATVWASTALGLDPEAERVARTVTRTVSEALAGQRPVAQLRPLLSPRVWMLMEHLVRGGAAHGMRLAGLRLQSPRAGVVEVSARLASTNRCAALALRLERRTVRWAVTTLEAGLAPDGRMPARS